MLLKTLVLGALGTNCYILSHEESHEALIIDPAFDANKEIEGYLTKNHLSPLGILITHGHFDHIGEVNALRDKYKLPVYASLEEMNMMKDSTRNLSVGFLGASMTVHGDHIIKDGEMIKIGSFEFVCIEVAGHTEESLCFYFEKEKYLFSGDTLFKNSVGRTDFYRGGPNDLIENIKQKLLVLPKDVQVFPGHGSATSIGYEKENNMFLR